MTDARCSPDSANVDVLIQRLRAANAGGLREQAYQSLCGDAADALSRQCSAGSEGLPFQKRVLNWLMECFSMDVCRDGTERNHRFLEEALELVQSLGCTRSESHQLVDYVFDRPAGEPMQELGGVQVTLAALCFPHDLNMEEAAERELARVWTKIEKIRAKQAAKPKHSPLPQAVDPAQGSSKEENFCHWLKGYLGAIKGRDELDAREANVVRNKLNEMLDGAPPISSTNCGGGK